MGKDKVRHVIERPRADGATRYHWQPSATIRALGMSPEALGMDRGTALVRAANLNRLADDLRRGNKAGENGPKPGSVALLFRSFKASDEYRDLKPRTQRDYTYYLDKIEAEFGHVMVLALTPLAIKTYYKRVRREKGTPWAYHILSYFRGALSWGVGEDWLPSNPALDVKVSAPAKRTVTWAPEQCTTYIAQAKTDGWASVVAMAYVFDSIGQSPIDVRTLKRKAYDGRRIDVSRSKTGMKGGAILLFPEAKDALDEYLASQPAKLPDAPLFTHDRKGGEWNVYALNKIHAKIRKAAGLPKELQLQDFRTTAMTEGGEAEGTVDQLRGFARHATRAAGEHYVHPTTEYVDDLQAKRLALRNRKRKNAVLGSRLPSFA